MTGKRIPKGSCELCHAPCRGVRCRSCHNWQRRWDAMTPEEQQAELNAMDWWASVQEEDRRREGR